VLEADAIDRSYACKIGEMRSPKVSACSFPRAGYTIKFSELINVQGQAEPTLSLSRLHPMVKTAPSLRFS